MPTDDYWRDEASYIAKVRALQSANWPAEIPREPQYPFGEIGITDYLTTWAERIPDRPLIVFYGREVTYREIDQLSDRFAARLQKEGVCPGDSVALFLGTCPQFVIAFFGILKAGCVHVPVNPMFKEHELLYELNDSQAQIVVADHALVPMVQKIQNQTTVRQVFATGLAEMIPEDPAYHVPKSVLAGPRSSSDTVDFLPTLENSQDTPAKVETDLDAVAALNYTGGTTGMPKGCVHTQRDMIYTAATACGVNTPLASGDVTINFHPLFWIAGEDIGLLFPVFQGATCVLLARWDALGYMQAVQRYRVNRAVLLVDNAVDLMEHPQVKDYDLTSIETTGVSSFVKKLNTDYRAQWQALTGSTMVELSYGMTETHTCDSFTYGFQGDNFDVSVEPILVGLPVVGTDFKICDFDTGVLQPLGAEGEICVRSPSNLKAYWNKPEATKDALRDGWLHTGDIGYIDEMGLLHFLGRRKEMLKVKGMSVFPAEIEAFLGRHSAIVGSGVIGREDAERGQVPVAFVLIDPENETPPSELQLTAWCKETMATYKCPEIRIVDALPMTATGKVKKGELAKRL